MRYHQSSVQIMYPLKDNEDTTFFPVFTLSKICRNIMEGEAEFNRKQYSEFQTSLS